jgi:hypothetical protein
MILEEVAKHGSISATLMSDSNTFEFPALDDSGWWDYDNDKPIRFPCKDTECQMMDDRGAFVKVCIIAEKDGITFGWRTNGFNMVYFSDDMSEFRPLDWNRKAEAEKKRVVDAVIEAMKPNPLTGTMEKWFGKLYDLGCLRLPPEKN